MAYWPNTDNTDKIGPVPELTGNKISYLFAIFRRFGPGRSIDSAESGSVTAFTHNRWSTVFGVFQWYHW